MGDNTSKNTLHLKYIHTSGTKNYWIINILQNPAIKDISATEKETQRGAKHVPPNHPRAESRQGRIPDQARLTVTQY